MNQLSLSKILGRLTAMQFDQTDDIQIRRFEMFGIELCSVSYNHISGIYTLNEYRPNQKFEFDNADLTAIEVYECISELQETF